jgi:hypothetical protein
MNPDMYGVEILTKDFRKYFQTWQDGKNEGTINLKNSNTGEMIATHEDLEKRFRHLHGFLNKIDPNAFVHSSFNG